MLKHGRLELRASWLRMDAGVDPQICAKHTGNARNLAQKTCRAPIKALAFPVGATPAGRPAVAYIARLRIQSR